MSLPTTPTDHLPAQFEGAWPAAAPVTEILLLLPAEQEAALHGLAVATGLTCGVLIRQILREYLSVPSRRRERGPGSPGPDPAGR